MKRFLLGLLLLPTAALADGWQVAPVAKTPRALATPGTVLERANLSPWGNIQVTQVGPEGLVGAPIRVVSAVTTNPTVASGASTIVLAANVARSGFRVQNNTAASICCSESGEVLTGIVPSLSNRCEVLSANASLNSMPNVVTTTAITCYQASGAGVNTITVVEW